MSSAPARLSDAEVRRLRSRAQGFDGGVTTVVDAVRRVVALPAQDIRASRLAVRARSTGPDADAVVRACRRGAGAPAGVVRTWLMRGTLHAVAAEDVRWLVALLGPPFAAAGARRRRELGLDDPTCARALAAIEDELAGAPPLLRDDLVGRLAARGVRLDPRSQAPAHLLAYAAQRGLVCRGPDGPADEATYVLLDEWVSPAGLAGSAGSSEPAGPPASDDRDGALAALARRYLRGHAPATADDLRAWSGLPARDARRAVALVTDEMREVTTPGGMAWVPGGDVETPSEPVVRVLGAFDPYLLGYRDRNLAVAPAFGHRVRAGGGMIAPTVLADGRVVATWRSRRTAAGLAVTVQPFARMAPSVRTAVEAEVADVGRFLGAAATASFDAPLP